MVWIQEDVSFSLTTCKKTTFVSRKYLNERSIRHGYMYMYYIVQTAGRGPIPWCRFKVEGGHLARGVNCAVCLVE